MTIFDLSPAEKLDRRRDNLMKHPASILTWEEVKRRIRSGYGR